MDAVFFSLKRGFHATLRCSRPLLANVGLTPARFDVLFALTRSHHRLATQASLRRMLGVARASMCEMLATLEQLGWVRRERDRDDRRTHRVMLTEKGRALLERGYAEGVSSGRVPLAVDSALSRGDLRVDPLVDLDRLHHLSKLIRRFFGDTAIDELYPWHPDDYLGALAMVTPGSSEFLAPSDCFNPQPIYWSPGEKMIG